MKYFLEDEDTKMARQSEARKHIFNWWIEKWSLTHSLGVCHNCCEHSGKDKKKENKTVCQFRTTFIDWKKNITKLVSVSLCISSFN